MKMARTCSNRAHRSGFPADFRLRKILQSSPDLPFHEPLFATLYLPIQTELVQTPINKVVVLTWIFNFVNYTMNQIATVWVLRIVEITLSVVSSGVDSVRFRKPTEHVVADRLRS